MPGATPRRASTESDKFGSGSLTGQKIQVTCLGNSFFVRLVSEFAVGQVSSIAPVDFIQVVPIFRVVGSPRSPESAHVALTRRL